MFGHHHRQSRHGSPGRGSRSWGPFTVEWGSEAGDHPRGRGRRRMFGGDELKLLLLKLIEDAPRHGYDLIREIEERTGGAYAPSPGVVYPTLTMLADMDLIGEQATDGAKKVFAITTAGRAHLTEREELVASLMERLADLGSMRERSRKGPVQRSMGNLRQVLIHRIGNGDVPQDMLHQIAAIIDDAAQKIERL